MQFETIILDLKHTCEMWKNSMLSPKGRRYVNWQGGFWQAINGDWYGVKDSIANDYWHKKYSKWFWAQYDFLEVEDYTGEIELIDLD